MKPVTEHLISISCPALATKKTNQNQIFKFIKHPTQAQEHSLCLANTFELAELALKNHSSGLIVTESVFEKINQLILPENLSLWACKNIQEAMSQVFHLFNGYFALNTGIHPSAIISPTAVIGTGCIIEPYAVIGENVNIGDHSKIGAHTVLENNSSIGSHTLISSHVHVGFNCHIGSYCYIGPHCVFGSDGFGFYSDKKGHHKISQIGHVIIENHCEFGAHCAVDRAAFDVTLIKKGSKFDNFIHIAHNCEIGENALVAAGFILAGSTKIGKNLIAAGGVHANGHIKITDNVTLTARTGVVNSIENSGFYGGFPELDHKQNLKVMMSQQHIPEMRKKINQILRHLNLTD